MPHGEPRPASADDWPIHDVARLTGTTSRTLRHYDDIGLLAPSRTGPNGYRFYDRDALVRLQRILLLRDLGLGLTTVAEVLDHERDARSALGAHLEWLRAERDRLGRQIGAVEATIHDLGGGRRLVAEDMFDGFDHTRYRDEVERRWGKDAYAAGDAWWRGMTDGQRGAWRERAADLGRAWSEAAERGVVPDSAEAQALAERHVAWLSGIPGTPGAGHPPREYVLGLGEMYVADPRFAASYGGPAGAELVRDALRAYVEARP